MSAASGAAASRFRNPVSTYSGIDISSNATNSSIEFARRHQHHHAEQREQQREVILAAPGGRMSPACWSATRARSTRRRRGTAAWRRAPGASCTNAPSKSELFSFVGNVRPITASRPTSVIQPNSCLPPMRPHGTDAASARPPTRGRSARRAPTRARAEASRSAVISESEQASRAGGLSRQTLEEAERSPCLPDRSAMLGATPNKHEHEHEDSQRRPLRCPSHPAGAGSAGRRHLAPQKICFATRST